MNSATPNIAKILDSFGNNKLILVLIIIQYGHTTDNAKNRPGLSVNLMCLFVNNERKKNLILGEKK
tara:strand:- start:149 stop:346 length:198 start_codon:yes stop_codon:yes gene_type:complete